MAKQKRTKDEAPKPEPVLVEESPKVEEPVEVPQAEEVKTEVQKQTVWFVVKGGLVVRSYSIENHGKAAGSLAEQYASKIGGSISAS